MVEVSAHDDFTGNGGLVGENSGTICDCYAARRISGKDNLGSLARNNSSTVPTRLRMHGFVTLATN